MHVSGVATEGGGGNCMRGNFPQAPIGHPVRSMQTRGDFHVDEKMGAGLQDLLPRFTCIDAVRRTFFNLFLQSSDYEKGDVEVLEEVALVGPQ